MNKKNEQESYTAKYSRWNSVSNLRKECVKLQLYSERLYDDRLKYDKESKQHQETVRKQRHEINKLRKELREAQSKLEVANATITAGEQPEIVETTIRFDRNGCEVVYARTADGRLFRYRMPDYPGMNSWFQFPPLVQSATEE